MKLHNSKLLRLVLNSPKFQNWKKSVEKSGTVISELNILSQISRNKDEIFSIFLDCVMVTPEGNMTPRCMLLRGNSVIIIPIIYCDDGELYTLMIKQRRPIDGEYMTEFPGGLLDNGDELPVRIAAQEVNEELGFDIPEDEIISLNNKPLSVCSGILDEKVHFFFFKRNMSKLELTQIHNKKSGQNDDGEFLNIQCVNMKDVSKLDNFSALVGIKLIEKALGQTF
jgi:8-oxo-dGTP pyrophosphatase MutT (NUDIX family)